VIKVPGLYFLGLAWSNTRGSALIGWVGDDAEFSAGKIGATAGITTDYGYEGAPTPSVEGALEGVNP
jgi:hypothetical protein